MVTKKDTLIPEDACEDALRKVLAVDRPSLIEENRRLHRAMVEGVPVEYRAEDGTIRGDEPPWVYRRVKHSKDELYDKESTYPRLSCRTA